MYITETGWAITSTCVGLGMPLNPSPGVTGKPVPGWDGKIYTLGNIVVIYGRLNIFVIKCKSTCIVYIDNDNVNNK